LAPGSPNQLVGLGSLFEGVSDSLRSLIEERVRPLRLQPGQPLFDFRALPPGVAVVQDGCLRLLALDEVGDPFTLTKVWPGEATGWSSLLRGATGYCARASRESRIWLLPKDDFLRLYCTEPELQDRLQTVQLEELYAVASSIRKANLADSERLAAWARKETQDQNKENRTLILEPGQHQVDLDWGPWLVSSANLQGIQIGEELVGPRLLEVQGKLPARLIAKQDIPVEMRLAKRDQPLAEVRSSELSLVSLEREKEALEDWYGELGTSVDYPFLKASGEGEAAIACLRMLARHFDIPFRRDVVTRVIEDQRRRNDGKLELYQLAVICELNGLQTKGKTIELEKISTLECPILIQGPRGEMVIWEFHRDSSLLLSEPYEGQLTVPLGYLSELCRDGRLEAYEVCRSSLTPVRRFGLTWFLPALQKYKDVLIQVLAASFFVQLFGLLMPLLIQQIIDAVIVQGNLSSLNVLGTLLVVMALTQAVLGSLRTYLFSDATNRIDLSLASKIIDHLFKLPLGFFGERPVGEISSRIQELEKVRSFLTGTALTTVLDASFALLYIGVMLLYSVPLTFWALAVVPLFVGVSIATTPILRRQLREQAEANSRVQSHVVETLGGMETVKGQSMELHTRWRWQQLYGVQVQSGFRNTVLSTASASTTRFLEQLSGLLILWIGAGMVLQGQLTLGQLIAFRILANYVTTPLLRLTNLWQNFQETSLSMERLADVVDQKEEIEVTGVRNPPIPAVVGDVEYKSLSFRFNNKGPLILNNVSFSVPQGAFTGLVGSSGSGKSTLLKLLTRLYEHESGLIRVDGHDISKVDLYSLRSQIGVVPQDSVLFDGTILENITYTHLNSPFEDVLMASQIACAHSFIEDLPNGYNTRVGERGNALSGGQRQRIAIARMILQRPRILILDEATSALDLKTEKQLLENIRSAFAGITVFFITHRIHSLKNADQILVLHQGHLVESGRHHELMSHQGRYFTLWQQQKALS